MWLETNLVKMYISKKIMLRTFPELCVLPNSEVLKLKDEVMIIRLVLLLESD